MAQIIIDIVERFGYAGIVFLIAAENLFPPIPSEVILTFAGFLTTVSALGYGGTVAAATAGSMLGAVILYAAGRALRPQRMELLLQSKAAQRLHLSAENYRAACQKFARHGKAGVLLFRCVPIMRSVISVPAGMAQMPWAQFLPLTLLGSLLWNMLLVGLGAGAGLYWRDICAFFASLTRYTRATLAAAVLIIAVVLYARRAHRKNKEEKARDAAA